MEGVNWGEGVNRGGVNCEGSFPVPVPEKNERGERHPFGPSSFLPPPPPLKGQGKLGGE